MVNIAIFGDGSLKTIITGSKNNVDGVPTFKTATFGMLKLAYIPKPHSIILLIDFLTTF